jgi:hypothetical protein
MIRRILIVLLPLLIVVLLLEVVLRSTNLFHARLAFTEPDRTIVYRFTPGSAYWFQGENDHSITGRINHLGWRDRERSTGKPPGTYRIAVIGDSFVEAFQVEQDSTFLSIAERNLNGPARASARRVELMNFGRSGMSQSEELIVFERDVLPCRPDMVLLLFTPQNDIADIKPATAADTSRPFFYVMANDSLRLDTSFTSTRSFRMRELINPLKQRSALISLIAERYNLWQRMRAQRALSRGSDAAPSKLAFSRELRMCTASPDPIMADNYALCKRLIARIGAECKTHGIAFSVAAVPLMYQPDIAVQLRAMDASFDMEFFDRDLAVLADSTGATYIPLTAAFRSRTLATGRLLHWSHWNYDGHRLVGEILTRVLGGWSEGDIH